MKNPRHTRPVLRSALLLMCMAAHATADLVPTYVTHFTGSASVGTADNCAASAAGYSYPHGIAAAADWTVYITELHGKRVRAINWTTQITTVVSTGFSNPHYTIFSPHDDQRYVVLSESNHCLKRIERSTGTVTSFAGSCGSTAAFADGRGSAARFNDPRL